MRCTAREKAAFIQDGNGIDTQQGSQQETSKAKSHFCSFLIFLIEKNVRKQQQQVVLFLGTISSEQVEADIFNVEGSPRTHLHT